jgi:hypothetical protein
MVPTASLHWKAHWRDLTMLPTAWSRSDLLGYVRYCRQRVRETLEGMTDVKAATLLPPDHRYRGQPYAWILTGIPGHTTSTRRRSGSSSLPPA